MTDSYRDMVRKYNPKTEAEVAAEVASFLTAEDWDCYPEVAFGKLINRKTVPQLAGLLRGQSVCDLVAVKPGLLMIVECKKTYSLELIEQAMEWTRLAPLVAMAVPSMALNNRSALKDHLRDYFGMGTVGVTSHGTSWQWRPRLLRHNLRHVTPLAAVLQERMKLASAGERWTYRETPYQATMSHIRCLLAWLGPMRMADLFHKLEDDSLHHYSSTTSLRSSVSRSIHTGIEPDLVVGKDRLLSWHPELCSKGERYIDHIRQWSDTRRKMAKASSAPCLQN